MILTFAMFIGPISSAKKCFSFPGMDVQNTFDKKQEKIRELRFAFLSIGVVIIIIISLLLFYDAYVCVCFV